MQEVSPCTKSLQTYQLHPTEMIIYTLYTTQSQKPCKFKYRHNMMLIAPEMLQSSVWPFVSCASKVLLILKAQDFPLNPQTPLFAPQQARLPNDLPIYPSDLLDFLCRCFNVFLKFSKSKLSLRNVALGSFIDLIFVDLLCFWTMSLVPSITMNKMIQSDILMDI